MKEIIAWAILLGIIMKALIYIKDNSKKGVKCIGCPFADSCTHHCTKGKAK